MDAKTLETMATLQAAMLDLRTRTGDDNLAHAIERGRFQLQRVTYPKLNGRGKPSGRPTITPLSEWAPLSEHIANLRAVGA